MMFEEMAWPIFFLVLALFLIGGFCLGLWFAQKRLSKNLDFSDLRWAHLQGVLSDDAFSPLFITAVQTLKTTQSGDVGVLGYLLEASCLRQGGAPQAAVKVHRMLLAKPNLSDELKDLIHLQLVQDYLVQQDWHAAETLLASLPRSLQKKTPTKFLLGYLYIKSGKTAAGFSILRKFLNEKSLPVLHSFFLETQVTFARALAQQGNFSAVDELTGEILRIAPDNLEAWVLRGEAAKQNKDTAKVEVIVQEVLARRKREGAIASLDARIAALSL